MNKITEEDIPFKALEDLGAKVSYCPLDDLHLGTGYGMDWLKKVPTEKRLTVWGAISALDNVFLWAGINGYTLKVGAPPGTIGTWYSSVSDQNPPEVKV